VLESFRITERERERERKSSGVYPNYDAHSTLTRTKKSSAAVRPSAAEKGDSHKKTKRSGEAERSGEEGFGGFPRKQYNTTRPRAQQAKRNGEGEFLGL
jgi:hypothetical protein